MFTSYRVIQNRTLGNRTIGGPKRTIPWILAALGFALVGCEPVQSLLPFFEQKDIVFDPTLIGIWVNKDGDGGQMKLRFERAEGEPDTYKLELFIHDDEPDKGKPEEGTVTFSAHLFQAGESRFLDFYPLSYSAKWGSQVGEFKAKENVFGVPTHTVYRVKLDGARLNLAWLDDDYVKRFIEKNHLALGMESTESFVLIGKTDELRANLLVRAEKEDLLDHDGVEFVREK